MRQIISKIMLDLLASSAEITSAYVKKHFKTNEEYNNLKTKYENLKKDYDLLITLIEQDYKERVKAAEKSAEATKLLNSYKAFFSKLEIGET